jgi:sarcosine oxidase, subunit alpha
VLDRMEDYLQTEWPHLQVWLNSVTEHWAATVITGPRARDILAPITTGCDLSPAAFPHLAWRAARIAGHAVRLYRISFTGELSYEVHCDARVAMAVWQALHAAGAPHGLTPYGTEAMHVLRAEKAYPIIGQETDGTVCPDDLGLGWAVSKQKPDFIGKRALARPELNRADRRHLVGLLPDAMIPEGAQITAQPGGTPPVAMLGHVTSAYISPGTGAPFALALVAGGRARIGGQAYARFAGHTVRCAIVDPVFLDPEGARLHG